MKRSVLSVLMVAACVACVPLSCSAKPGPGNLLDGAT